MIGTVMIFNCERVIPELNLEVTNEGEVFRNCKNKGTVLKETYFLWAAVSRSSLKRLF